MPDIYDDDRLDTPTDDTTASGWRARQTLARSERRAARQHARAAVRAARSRRRKVLLGQRPDAPSFVPFAALALAIILGVGVLTQITSPAPKSDAVEPTPHSSSTPTVAGPRDVLQAWARSYFTLADIRWQEHTLAGSVPTLQQQLLALRTGADAPFADTGRAAVDDITIRPTAQPAPGDGWTRTVDVLLTLQDGQQWVTTATVALVDTDGAWQIDTVTAVETAQP